MEVSTETPSQLDCWFSATLAFEINKHYMELSQSLPFLVALANMISLPQHKYSFQDINTSNLYEWDRKAWAQEGVLRSQMFPEIEGNAPIAASLYALMVGAKAVHSVDIF